MKLSFLLVQHRTFLQHARLTHLAYAYAKLAEFARRIERARLRGLVRLQQAAPDAGIYSASLLAIHGCSQSVLEEHFSDEDVMDLADVVAYVRGESGLDLTFPLEELAERFLAPLHHELERAGVEIDDPEPQDGGENSAPHGAGRRENDARP